MPQHLAREAGKQATMHREAPYNEELSDQSSSNASEKS